MKHHFTDLDPGDPRLATEVLPVLRELRPHLTPEWFAAIHEEGHPEGLRFTAVYDDEGACVAVAGWRVFATTLWGRKLHVDDLVTTATGRSRGYGRALLQELARRAKEAGCAALDLDSGVHRKHAHRFYEREGLEMSAYHFTLPLSEEAAEAARQRATPESR